MKDPKRRAERIAPLIQREVSEIIQRKIKDPRIGFCTITKVQMTNDLKIAKIWVCVSGGEERERECLEGLQSAAGFIRTMLGQSLSLRYTPELRFYIDKSIDNLMTVDRLLKQIRHELHPELQESE